MPACFNKEVPWCVACGVTQPKLEPGEISRHKCDVCAKAIEVYRSDAELYQVSCNDRHSMRYFNGALVCTLCGYKTETGP